MIVAHSITEAEEKWKRDQQEDLDLSRVIGWLEASCERPPKETVSAESSTIKCLVDQWEALSLRGGILHRCWLHARAGEVSWLVVVPVAWRHELLREMHEGNTSGHLGVKRMLE